MPDLHKNFAYSTILTAPSPATSGTSLVVQGGAGANFPTPPFNATIWPAAAQPLVSNAEIVRVTAISTDTFTIVRAQESTSARTVIVGDQIAAGITVKTLTTDIEPFLNPTGAISPYAGRTVPTNWLACDGAAVSRTTYVTLFGVIAPTIAGNPTITIATPAVVTHTAHGFITGDALYLTTTGALPTGLAINTLYYVVKIDANSYNLSTTLANAIAGTKIATSGTQSGTHTGVACPYGLGDGTTTFNVPDLRGPVPAGADQMFGAAAASRLTLASPTVNGVYGTLGAVGGAQTHTILTAELASHTHGSNKSSGTSGSFGLVDSGAASSSGAWTTGSTGSDTAHNNVQPTQIVNYIIKT